jgi:hypothetical protein
MGVVRTSFLSILVLVSGVASATPASAQTVSTRPSAVTFVQSSIRPRLSEPARQVSLFRQAPASNQATGYGSGYGAGLYFGYLVMHFQSATRPVGFEIGYWYGLSEQLALNVLYSVSHRSISGYTGGGGYGGDNLISAMGGVDYRLTKGKGKKVSVGVLAGLAHELGSNALGVVPQATVKIPLNDKLDFYARAGFRLEFVTNATAKGLEAAVGISKPFGKY